MLTRPAIEYHLEDFTENAYVELLSLAKDRYRFEPFGTLQTAPHVLWRHDIDCSVHRAFRLAQLEAEAGLQSTFFLLLHSPYYNLLEKPIAALVREIQQLGHQLGLHFDGNFYGTFPSVEALEAKLSWEKGFLEDLFAQPISVFSFHDPDVSNLLQYEDNTLAGMTNTYGQALKTNYTYCSDSNGYWRFQRLKDLLLNNQEDRLHILTHPEWWVPSPMSPRDRISRCIDGRAISLQNSYDQLLAVYGRENVR